MSYIFLCHGSHEDTVRLTHCTRTLDIRTTIDGWLRTGSTAIQPGPLGKLAPELLGMIFEGLSGFREVAYLCLTCKLMMNVGQRRLHRVTREFFTPWAGCRLICLGDYFRNQKLPPGLLTDEEKHEIQRAPLKDVEDGAEDRLYLHAEAYYKPLFGWGCDAPRDEWWIGGHAILSKALKPYMPPELVYEDPTIRADKERYEALSQPGLAGSSAVVLCNLTKAEYVRENGITMPPGSRAFPLVNVLISQICWSDEGDWDMDENTTQTLIHGPWAGDRFCCIGLKDLPDVPKGLEKWLDVTERVNTFLLEIWGKV